MTYTIIVERRKPLSGNPKKSFFYIYDPVAWLPGFESPAQATDHVKALRNVYVGDQYGFDVIPGDQFGPLRSKYEHLIWYRPLPFEFDADIAMKMADLGNGPAPEPRG